MAFKDDLIKEIDNVFSIDFEERSGQKVPEASDLTLGKDAVKLDATFLYADMEGSTKMVDSRRWQFSSHIYKAFLNSACKIIRDAGGSIVAFDGDRVMAVFIGGTKNTDAVLAALRINHARILINERMKKKWDTSFELQQCCGIDTSEVRAIRTGIRGSNDLVWVGSGANYAAKLTELRTGSYNTWISEEVYKKIMDKAKISNNVNMWERRFWSKQDNKVIYRSHYYWNN